jgi:hypothetical protein
VVIEKRVGLKNITLDLPVEDVITWFGFFKNSPRFSKSFSICIIMMHAEKGLEKLGDFLANPNHIITSSIGKFNLIFFRPTCFSFTTYGDRRLYLINQIIII